MTAARRRAPRRAALATAALSVVMAFGALSGCTSARDTLGTNSSPCFRALAIAKGAVHGRGTFQGVRLVPVSSLRPFHHVDATLRSRSSTPLHNVCVVSYRGTFRADQVRRPAGPLPPSGTGHVALVVVSNPQNRLLATFVLAREPLRFRHVALGHTGAPSPPARLAGSRAHRPTVV